MSNNTPSRDDLAYVAAAIRRDRPHDSAPTYFLWALLTPIGFALADLAPMHAGLFWAVAGPLGGLLSVWLGMRSEHAAGVRNRENGALQGMHWGITALVMVLFGGYLATLGSGLEQARQAPGFLLLIGFGYALAGVHLNRGLLPTGLVMVAGYAAITLLQLPWAWTITGLACAISLFVSGMRVARG